LDALIASGEPTFVYFFASNCNFCRETTPILMPIAKELNIDLPQFNLIEFREYYRKYNIEFTPTLAYFENGKEVARVVGGIGASGYTADDIRAFLQNPKSLGDDAS
jgi:thiol-disulfide isomerase/thioredoxin